MFARQLAAFAIGASAVLLSVGCGPAVDIQQDYADALNLYNAETEALGHLQRDRQRLVDEHDKQIAEIISQHKQDAIAGQLGNVATELLGGLGNLQSGDEPLTEDNVLDRLDEIEDQDPQAAVQRAQEVAAALKTLPEAAQREIDLLKKELDEKLAPVDADIAQQQQEVDKAREFRDACKAALNP